MNKKITSQYYDDDVSSKSLQEQIDTYYIPKEKVEKNRIKLLLHYLSPGENEKILDIGCGVGTFAYHSAKAGAYAVGIDYSEESVKLAKTLNEKFGTDSKTEFINGKIDSLPFDDKTFDKIIAADIIEHLEEEEKKIMLIEMKRVLKDSGYIVLYTPNSIRDKIGLFYKRLTMQKINKWNVDVHFGLTTRRKYERILKENNMLYKFIYTDITRPYLANIPVINTLLSLSLLWIIRKPD